MATVKKSSVTFSEIKHETRVYHSGKRVGIVRKFCCGVDFRPDGHKNALFSIMMVKPDSEELRDCIRALVTIQIPERTFHWNFHHETALSEKKLKKYEQELNNQKA